MHMCMYVTFLLTKILLKIFLSQNIFARSVKLTALLEYLEQNFHVRNFSIIFAYEIYFATKTKKIIYYKYVHTYVLIQT